MKEKAAVFVFVIVTGCGDVPQPESVSVGPGSDSREVFAEFTDQAGIDFKHENGATGEFYFPEIMGSGAALLDYDSDGDLDLYLVQSGGFPGSGAGVVNRLYVNDLAQSGKLQFSERAAVAGVNDPGYGMGVATGDIDGDGDIDLFVTNYGANMLYRNNGDGTFEDMTPGSEQQDDSWSTSASFFDYDRDGDLDLYVANYVSFTTENNVRCTGRVGYRDYCDPKSYSPQPDRLWRNDGNGRFVDVSAASGIAGVHGNGLGTAVADFDNDGWPDVYVANDQQANFLWMNKGDGSFNELALITGSAYNVDGAAEASMGVSAGDYDGDGDEDLFMTHLGNQTNTVYRNNGNGDFSDVTDLAGLSIPSLGYTGFGTAWFDVNNDGLLDLYNANGAVQIEPLQAGGDFPYRQRDQLFVNEGGGRFVDASDWSGQSMQVAGVSRGVAFGDIDNDGDTDLVVANNNGSARLLINNLSTSNWLSVALVGTSSNRNGIGARVVLYRDGLPPLWRRVHSDGSYLSASDIRVHFGLGEIETIDAVEVYWPNGRAERWTDVKPNRILTLTEDTGTSFP